MDIKTFMQVVDSLVDLLDNPTNGMRDVCKAASLGDEALYLSLFVSVMSTSYVRSLLKVTNDREMVKKILSQMVEDVDDWDKSKNVVPRDQPLH